MCVHFINFAMGLDTPLLYASGDQDQSQLYEFIKDLKNKLLTKIFLHCIFFSMLNKLVNKKTFFIKFNFEHNHSCLYMNYNEQH